MTDGDSNLSTGSGLKVTKSLNGTKAGLGGERCFCEGCDPDEDWENGSDSVGGEARILHTGETTYCEVVLQKNCHQKQVKTLRKRSDSTVTLIIGRDRCHILRERALLAYFSKYFESLLYGSFKKGYKLCVELPESDQRVVKAFVNWTSSGVIDAASKEIPRQESHFYEKLWIYGNKILAPDFCDLALKFLVEKYRSGKIRATDIEYIYKHTIIGFKLRRFLVAACTF